MQNPMINAVAAHLLRHEAIRTVFLAAGRTALIEALIETVLQHGGVLHAAGPPPDFDITAARARAGDRLVVHKARPEEALSVLAVPDLLILDGEPNFFTVSTVLTAAAAQARRLGRPMPLTLVSDTAWPYGRRDLYPDPAAIPSHGLHPHERAGLRPGRAAPSAGTGLFTDRHHAIGENEPENGVLTAIEAFAGLQVPQAGLMSIGVLHGLTLIHAAQPNPTRAVSLALDALCLGEAARAGAEATEAARLALAVEAADLRRTLASANYRNEALHAALRREQSRLAVPQESASPPAAPADIAPRPSLRGLARRAMRAAGLRPAIAPAAPDETAQDNANIERLRASPVLDPAWYIARYEDIPETGVDPAEHYYRHGASEGRDPGPDFSTNFYLATNPDVAEAGHNALLHYLVCGQAEGRAAAP